MVRIPKAQWAARLAACQSEANANEKGRLFEDAVSFVLEKLPGVRLQTRDRNSAVGSEEIDLAFWNERQSRSVDFLPNIILVEVKNWSAPVGAPEVTVFEQKVKRRGIDFGILVAAKGISGELSVGNAAHDIIRGALSEGRRIVVLTIADLEPLRTSDDLIHLIQFKLCELVVTSSVV